MRSKKKEYDRLIDIADDIQLQPTPVGIDTYQVHTVKWIPVASTNTYSACMLVQSFLHLIFFRLLLVAFALSNVWDKFRHDTKKKPLNAMKLRPNIPCKIASWPTTRIHKIKIVGMNSLTEIAKHIIHTGSFYSSIQFDFWSISHSPQTHTFMRVVCWKYYRLNAQRP